MNRIKLRGFYQGYRLSIGLFVFWFLYLFVLTRYALWSHVGVSHMEPLFADLHAILSAIDCNGRGINVFETNPCDVAGRVHVYGSLWLSLGQLGLGSAHLFSKGFIVDIVFMAIAVMLLKPSSKREFAKSCLFLFSPAVTLGIERANNDLIVFSLLAVSALLYAKRDGFAQVSSLVIIYLSALLKFYPSVLLASSLIILKRNIKELIVFTVVTISLFAIWLTTNLNELLLIKDIAPKPLDFYATGARALLAYVGRPYPWILSIPTLWLFSGFIAVVAVGAIALASRLKSADIQPSSSRFNYVIFIFGLSILFATYALNSNYDYRWVFFIFAMPLLFDIQKANASDSFASRVATIGLICASLTMWMEAFRASGVFGLVNINVFFNIGRSTFSIELFQQFIKEFSAWVLFAILFAFAIKQSPFAMPRLNWRHPRQ
jgi:hypothetical protein